MHHLSEARKSFEALEKSREDILDLASEIVKASKQAIYAVHRSEMKDAERLIASAKAAIQKSKNILTKHPVNGLGNYHSALQEYVEAIAYSEFMTKGTIPSYKDSGVGVEDYFMGLSDLTGELARKAVLCATHRETVVLEKIAKVIDEIHGFFLSINLRNSELRKKVDAIKWNLKKVEEILYDMNVRR
ncbi:hypothetical protein HZB02_03805 [Candidatus Woesearchaeota archaeon]|nr:hypothetical protein [Candidatus Woesearchaeota archaeon]